MVRPRKERCENCVHLVEGGDVTEVDYGSAQRTYKCKAHGRPLQPTVLRGWCQHWDTSVAGRFESPRGDFVMVE